MVIGYMHFLWWWAYDYAPEGDLSAFTDEDVADAVDWEGDPGDLVTALTQSGFLDEDRRLHDWEDFAQKWIERRQADRERKRAKRSKASDIPETSDGQAPEVSSLSGVTGPNRTLTGPNRTGPISPNPSSHGEEGDAPKPPRGARKARRNGTAHAAQEPNASGPAELQPAAAGGGAGLDQSSGAEDGRIWKLALDALWAEGDGGAWRANVERLSELVPIGRAADGGLHLRAPPDGLAHAQRFRPRIVRALLDAGDAAASRVAIVEG